MSTPVSAVCLHNFIHIDSSLLFKIVNILGHIVEQDSFVVKHLDEEVCRRWFVNRPIFILCESVEWFRILNEKVDIKECFRSGKIVLAQIIVKAYFWSSEVRNARRY